MGRLPCFLRRQRQEQQEQQQHSVPGVLSWIEQVKPLLSWKSIKSIPPEGGWHSNLPVITEASSQVEKCGQFVTVSFFLTSLSLGKGDCIERGHEEAAKRFFVLHSFREGEGYFKIQGTDREDNDLREGLARHMLC